MVDEEYDAVPLPDKAKLLWRIIMLKGPVEVRLVVDRPHY